MAKFAVMASGSGSNFQALAEFFKQSHHELSVLLYDRKSAYAVKRANALSIPAVYLPFFQDVNTAEKIILETIQKHSIQLLVLAGFMRLLRPCFIDQCPCDIINIHPSLLPKHPGKNGLEDSYHSHDKTLGISIHKVDYGMDTGPIIAQYTLQREAQMNFDNFEEAIHQLEHRYYPQEIERILQNIQGDLS